MGVQGNSVSGWTFTDDSGKVYPAQQVGPQEWTYTDGDGNQHDIAGIAPDSGQPAQTNTQQKGGAIANPGGGASGWALLAKVTLGVSLVFFVGSIVYVIVAKPEA